MSKLIPAFLTKALIIYFSLTSLNQAYAHMHDAASKAYKVPVPTFSEQLVKDRLESLSSAIDVQYTPEVGRRIKEYTVSYRISGEKLLGKVDMYFPIFETEIAKRNLPDVLKYIAIVESHLDPNAKSRSGAVGLWQFIKSTAKMQGLTIGKYIDERRDPQKSTEAALEYLADLYESFDDWTLAIAAYNCGPGGVRKAIRRSGSREYWKLRKHLPIETQKYVPRIIAAMYLMQYYHHHNLVAVQISDDLRFSTSINDGKAHNFKKLAKELNINYNILRQLNTQFTSNHFPKNNGHLELHIPYESYERYLEVHDNSVYKLLLSKRKETELLRIKNEKIIEARQILKPLDPIQRILFDRIRPSRSKKVYYSTFAYN